MGLTPVEEQGLERCTTSSKATCTQDKCATRGIVGVRGSRRSGMYIMPTRRYGSEVKEPKDILERMQLQVLMPTTLKTIDTITPGGSCLPPGLFPNNKEGPLAAPLPSNVTPIKSQSRVTCDVCWPWGCSSTANRRMETEAYTLYQLESHVLLGGKTRQWLDARRCF